jgi:hypothetical protein
MRKRERSEESLPPQAEGANQDGKEEHEPLNATNNGGADHLQNSPSDTLANLEPRPSTQKPIHPFFLKAANRSPILPGGASPKPPAATARPTPGVRTSQLSSGGRSSTSKGSGGGGGGGGLVQMCLDAGQKEIGAVTCSLCGMVYMKQVDDVREHARLCSSLQAEKAAADRVRTPLTAAPPHLYSAALVKGGSSKSITNGGSENCERVHSTLIPSGFCCHRFNFIPSAGPRHAMTSGAEELSWLAALLEELGMRSSTADFHHGSAPTGETSRCTGFLWFREGVPAVEAVILYRENRRTVDEWASDASTNGTQGHRSQTLVDILSVWMNTSSSKADPEPDRKKGSGSNALSEVKPNQRPKGGAKPQQPVVDDLDLFEAVLRPSALANFFSKPTMTGSSTNVSKPEEPVVNPQVSLLKSVFDVFLQKAVYGYSLQPNEICLPSTLLPRYSTVPGDPVPALIEEALSLFTRRENASADGNNGRPSMRIPCPLYDCA